MINHRRQEQDLRHQADHQERLELQDHQDHKERLHQPGQRAREVEEVRSQKNRCVRPSHRQVHPLPLQGQLRRNQNTEQKKKSPNPARAGPESAYQQHRMEDHRLRQEHQILKAKELNPNQKHKQNLHHFHTHLLNNRVKTGQMNQNLIPKRWKLKRELGRPKICEIYLRPYYTRLRE
jgi:hypothetical protein